jgi:hypothetical protein
MLSPGSDGMTSPDPKRTKSGETSREGDTSIGDTSMGDISSGDIGNGGAGSGGASYVDASTQCGPTQFKQSIREMGKTRRTAAKSTMLALVSSMFPRLSTTAQLLDSIRSLTNYSTDGIVQQLRMAYTRAWHRKDNALMVQLGSIIRAAGVGRADMEHLLGYEVTARQYTQYLHHGLQSAGPGAVVEKAPCTRGRAHQVDCIERFVQFLVGHAILTANARTVTDSKKKVSCERYDKRRLNYLYK